MASITPEWWLGLVVRSCLFQFWRAIAKTVAVACGKLNMEVGCFALRLTGGHVLEL